MRHQLTPLGHRLKQACAYAQMTQRAVADAAGMHPQTFSRLTRGQTQDPPWLQMVAIAQVTGVSLDFLAGRFPHSGVITPRKASHERVDV